MDIERLLNSALPFIEKLLKQYGEFYPLAVVLNRDGGVSHVGTYDGNDKPPSEKVISELKNAIRAKKQDARVIAVFYDVTVTNPDINQKTDAIAVFMEANNDETAYIIYYPYQIMDGKQLSFTASWKNATAKEIFID